MRDRKRPIPLAYRHYNKDEIVMGKRMEDHLRFAVAYWHTFAWPGGDPFGGQTFERPWFGETMEHAKLKADVAFELFTLLGTPFYCFHDADVRPEGKTFAESRKNLEGHRRYFCCQAEADRGQTALGHGKPVLASPLHVRRIDQSRSGCVRLFGSDGEILHGCDQEARRRKLCAVGRARRL